MTYTLQRLAPGSFDLLLGGEIVGSLVREVSKDGHEGDWIVETLTESPPYPAPFTAETPKFGTLKAAADWVEAVVPDLRLRLKRCWTQDNYDCHSRPTDGNLAA